MPIQDELSNDACIRNLGQRLTALAEELRTGIGGFNGEQAAMRRRVGRIEEAIRQTAEQQVALDERLSVLERNHAAGDKATAKAMESHSQRITELGVELAMWPPAAEVQAVFYRLDQLLVDSDWLTAHIDLPSDSVQPCRSGLGATLYSLDASMKQCRMECDAMKECQQQTTALESKWRTDVDECNTQIQQGLLALGGSLRTQTEEAQRDLGRLAEHVFGFGRDLQATGEVALVTRLFTVEKQLEGVQSCLGTKADSHDTLLRLAAKADVVHTHDRLVSADGSSVFGV
mmetsp:Transcript_37755/g.74936  ORF Transcript_37755/g.74936 Transcript_37755/m.74936 type:complete len:288 (+) Transcript_37755:161-1024(+)